MRTDPRRDTDPWTDVLRAWPASYRRVGEAYARYARRLADLSLAYYRELAEAAGAPTRRPRTTPAGRDGVRPRIELRAPVGGTVAATFSLENRDAVPAAVSVAAGRWRAPDGTTFAGPVTIAPTATTIPAEGTVEVTVRATLPAEHFTAGATYELPLEVDGPTPASVELALHAEPAEADSRTEGESEARSGPYVVRCPRCGRRFERRTDDLRLRPHKTPEGDDCPERAGRRGDPDP